MNLHVGTWEIDFPKSGRNKLDWGHAIRPNERQVKE